jgi:hypothetical protein
MKIRTKYYCEYCGKEFETEASCQAHEETHALELNIVGKNYIEVREFPDIIKVTTPTKENQVAVYEFLRIDDAV